MGGENSQIIKKNREETCYKIRDITSAELSPTIEQG